MQDERWEDLVDAIEGKFVIQERRKGQLEDKYSGAPKADIEYIVFDGPRGKMKVERVSRFAVIEERVMYHRHAKGSQVERKYSDTEKTHRVTLYEWDPRSDGWEEIDLTEMFR